MRQYVIAKIIGLFLTLRIAGHVGIATNFQPIGDPWNPVAYAACLHRDLRETDLVVAHPTLPCGSRVWIYNLRNGRSVVARVGDRGPRHAALDLAPATTRSIRANGWERVLFAPLDVLSQEAESPRIVLKKTQRHVAGRAQEASDLPRSVAVVDHE
jgi:hypothetical protein